VTPKLAALTALTDADLLLQEELEAIEAESQTKSQLKKKERLPADLLIRPTPTPPAKATPPPPNKPKKSGAIQLAPLKGKSREAATPIPTSSQTRVDAKKCKEVLRNLRKIPEAFIFLEPVDVIAANCPT
jgi:transcription initiation factor TFIID subunit 2